jgi:hypothetical protein
MVIGLCGYAGSGKSEAAKYLASTYGYERRHVGAPMKSMLRAVGLSEEELDGAAKEEPSDNLLGVTPREAMITLGSDWGRKLIHPDLWARIWARQVKPGERVVNESVRFPNEVEAIRSLDGIIIRIDRGGQIPAKFKWGPVGYFLYLIGIMFGIDDSERVDRLDADYTINNPTGSIEFLRQSIDAIMQEIDIDDTEMRVAA